MLSRRDVLGSSLALLAAGVATTGSSCASEWVASAAPAIRLKRIT